MPEKQAVSAILNLVRKCLRKYMQDRSKWHNFILLGYDSLLKMLRNIGEVDYIQSEFSATAQKNKNSPFFLMGQK